MDDVRNIRVRLEPVKRAVVGFSWGMGYLVQETRGKLPIVLRVPAVPGDRERLDDPWWLLIVTLFLPVVF